MPPPYGYPWCDSGRRRRLANPLPAVAAMLLAVPQVSIAEAVEDAPSVLPERGGEQADGMPEPLPPFLAVPYEPADVSAAPAVAPVFVLPPVDRFLPPRAVAVPVLRCNGFRFDGNTVFDDDELAGLLGAFLGREMCREDLDQLRFKITRHYVANGYINSGATLPAQDFRDGILRIHVTEGHLTEVIATGNKGLSDRYLSSRILIDRKRPLHFPSIQKRLQVLQENDNIIRLNAELKPGLVPGEALMVIEVGESPKWSYGFDVHNQRSPSVGGEQAELWFENRNLSGSSDLLRARLGLFSGNPDELDFAGLDNLALQYQRPVLADDTTFLLGWTTEDYSILEEPFRGLAIEGESWSLVAGLRRPLFRSLEDEVWVSLLLERSHDETTVLGRPFTVSPGSVDGELDLTLLRLGLDWTRRSGRSAFTVRSTVTAGINALGATDPPTEPDGTFFTWCSESQYTRRFDERGDLWVIHAGLALSNDPLPPPAQFQLGGRHTVRGYRENFLVRDNGFCGGIDLRFPLLTDERGWNLAVVPFIDGGVGWNDGSDESEALLAAGCGVIAEYGGWFRGELFYGVPFMNREDESDDLQDEGVHFHMTVARF